MARNCKLLDKPDQAACGQAVLRWAEAALRYFSAGNWHFNGWRWECLDIHPRPGAIEHRAGLVFAAEIHDRREIRLPLEAPDDIDAAPVAEFVAQQDDVVAGTGEFFRQVAAGNRVEIRDDGVRPVRGYVMHQQAAKCGLPVDDHEA